MKVARVADTFLLFTDYHLGYSTGMVFLSVNQIKQTGFFKFFVGVSCITLSVWGVLKSLELNLAGHCVQLIACTIYFA